MNAATAIKHIGNEFRIKPEIIEEGRRFYKDGPVVGGDFPKEEEMY